MTQTEKIINESLTESILVTDYVPNLLDNEVQSKIKDLKIESILLIITKAIETLDTVESRAEYEDVIFNYLKNLVIEKIKTTETFVAIDNTTMTPANIDDNLMLFSNMNYTIEFLSYMKNNFGKDYSICKLDPNTIDRFLYSAIALKGFSRIVVNNGHNTIIIESEDILSTIDYKNWSSEMKKVENPKFYSILSRYLQELKCNANYDGKKEKLLSMQNELFEEFKNAKFITPMKGMKDLEANILSGKPLVFEFASIENNDSSLTPIFTDWEEFYKAYTKEWSGEIWTIKDLARSKDIVINCATLGCTFSKNTIEKLLT